jgi:MoaD family protein
MQVTVKYRGYLTSLTKIAAEQIDAKTVKDTLSHIKMNFGKEAEKNAKAMIIAVNGESILHRMLLKTPLQDGDEVSFLPICGGG